ncbi:MAG: hypothetical protein AAB647_04385, partial [Patescibacteria group bacterium]
MVTYTQTLAEQQIHNLLASHFEGEKIVIQAVPEGESGNLAVPVFAVAKRQATSPRLVSEELAEQIDLTK